MTFDKNPLSDPKSPIAFTIPVFGVVAIAEEYCFEIINYKEDLNDLFKKILDDSLIKFKISNPELYEKAKELGVILSEKLEKI